MADVKWIKITINMFDDEKIKIIESMPEADTILIIWIKLLSLAGKTNAGGYIFLNENIPYTDEMLATIFNRPLSTVRLALKTFKQFEMIEIDDKGIYISNWEKHQSIDKLEKIREQNRLRKQKQRERQKQLMQPTKDEIGITDNGHVTVTLRHATEEELEEDIDIDKDIDINNTISKDIVSSTKVQPIVQKWNSLGLQKIISINPGTNRYKLLNARLKEYGMENLLKAIDNIKQSSFLKGQNKRGWTITFDWLIKPNNFLKVLEGNYADKEAQNEIYSRNNKDHGGTGQKYDFSKYEV